MTVPPGAVRQVRWLRWLLTLWLLGLAALPPLLAQTAIGSGVLEAARVLPGQRQLMLSGWAAPERPSLFLTQLIVQLGGQTIYRGRMQRGERPDVAGTTGRPDWLSSGFSAQVALPASLPAGPQPIRVRMRLGDGSEFALRLADDVSTVWIPEPTRLPVRVGLVLALALFTPPMLLLAAAPATRFLAKRGRLAHAVPVAFGASILLSFALLVHSGLTGSSIRLLLDAQPTVTTGSEAAPVWLGEPRPVRSDEWEVITPLAIAQLRHDPPLPLINRNLGADGANMLVIGMTGVPVAHVSSLAKPATWGFFVLDPPHALAWHWWFPFFSCLAALWLLLRRAFGLEWRLAAVLAASVALAPYSVVFSGWPAYALFFPALALLLADVALRSTRIATAAAAGSALGLALAGFALVLYPAWQISLGWLFALFAAGWFWRARAHLRFGAAQVVALVLALVLAALLLGAWWIDARDAVQAIRDTVYPGQRSAEVGGDIDRWFLVKGLMSPITMYVESSLTHASDAGSFVLLPLPLALGVLLVWRATRRLDTVALALLAFLAWTLGFMFVGLPSALAQLTLWSSTTSYRMDLALGTAQALLLGWLATVPAAPRGSQGGAVAAVTLLTALHTAWLLHRVPPQIGALVPASVALLICAATATAAWLLLTQRFGAFALLLCGWTLGSALPFNPVAQAPGPIELKPALAQARLAQPDAAGRRGVAVLDERAWSMVLPAAGVPVTNSVFYYPQRSLWQALDPGGSQRVLHNRYQRLLLVGAPLPAGTRSWRIESPRLDEVRVTLDPGRFDFRLLGSRFVLAPAGTAAALAGNATLRRCEAEAGYGLFEVTDVAPER